MRLFNITEEVLSNGSGLPAEKCENKNVRFKTQIYYMKLLKIVK